MKLKKKDEQEARAEYEKKQLKSLQLLSSAASYIAVLDPNQMGRNKLRRMLNFSRFCHPPRQI